MMAAASLALPRLAPTIPREVYVPGENLLSAPLALALLESKLVTDDMLRPGPNATLIEVLAEPDARELSMHALSTWWGNLQHQYPMKHFRWELHVQQLEDKTGGINKSEAPVGWFCITRNQNIDIPRFSLARRAGQLESCLEGFGQTVLAVLDDAMRLIPDSLTPFTALDFAEQMYWQECKNDEEMIQQAIHDGTIEIRVGAGADEIPPNDLLTRAKFYEDMPTWAAKPRRVASREAIVRAARGKNYEKSVIAACDSIIELVSRDSFNLNPWECGAHHSGDYAVDACVVLLWREHDRVGQVIDDWINGIYQMGEYTEFIDSPPVPLTKKGLLRYVRRTERMMAIAQRTEHLIDLIGDPL